MEYSVMLGLILLTAIIAISAFGTKTGTMWTNVDTKIESTQTGR